MLAGEPLFVARYHMVRDHWQIIKHAGDGQRAEGRTDAVALTETPPEVLAAAVSAARLIGDGFYGVDLKQTPAGVFVIEVNDNPNLDLGAEDDILGDEIYRRLLGHLLDKFEDRGAHASTGLASEPAVARPRLQNGPGPQSALIES